MSTKSKVLKKKSLKLIEDLSKQEALTVREFKQKHSTETWEECRSTLRSSILRTEGPITKTNLNTLTGIYYRELKKREEDFLTQYLIKKNKSRHYEDPKK